MAPRGCDCRRFCLRQTRATPKAGRAGPQPRARAWLRTTHAQHAREDACRWTGKPTLAREHKRTGTRARACARTHGPAHAHKCAHKHARKHTHGPHTSAWTLPRTCARARTRAKPRTHAHTTDSEPRGHSYTRTRTLSWPARTQTDMHARAHAGTHVRACAHVRVWLHSPESVCVRVCVCFCA